MDIEGSNGETVTAGLDGLEKRCEQYFKLGCRFARWRALFRVGDGTPSDAAIYENAYAIAKYAAIC